MDAVRYVVDNGIKWRAMPADYPPWQTVYYHFARWHRRGVVAFLREQLRRQIRTGQGRCSWPVTLIVNSQSVKGAETVSKATRGFDAAKKSMAARDASPSTPRPTGDDHGDARRP
ncbi:hypothetical protein SCALM49S_04369 [Streptomyces californicus]